MSSASRAGAATRELTSAPVFAALGDESRLRLVTRLSREGPRSITQLTAGGTLTRQGVTKHLHVLAQAGVARSTPQGRERIWELEPQPMVTARDRLSQLSAQWDEALGRLARLVSTTEDATSGTAS